MMKKLSLRLSAAAFAFLFFCVSTLTGFASVTTSYALDDAAYVFDEAQTAELEAKMQEASDKTGWQFIVHTSYNGVHSDDMKSYYDRYFKSQDYQKNAIMLVIDRLSDNRTILAYGDVKGYFANDTSRYDNIKSAMKPYLNSGDMYGATLVFIEKAAAVHDMGKTLKILLVLQKFGIIIGIVAIVAGLLVFFITKSRYKNTGKAGTYDLAANSSVNLEEAEDQFVTQHTTVRTIKTDSSSGSSSGGSSKSGHSSGTF